MTTTQNIFLCGVGGQGVLLASELLCEVAMQNGLDVKKSEVHGMAQRGGSVVSHVRYGDVVHSPLIELGQADVLMSFELVESLRWLHFLKPGGTVITSTQRIVPITAVQKGGMPYPDDVVPSLKARAGQVCAIPALEMAKEAGNAKAVNTLLLGRMARDTDIPQDFWLEVITKMVKPKTIDINRRAFLMGWEYENAPANQ